MYQEQSDYEKKMIEAFINKPEKTLWYQMAFSKFTYNGVDTMKWHWSWWAFFGGFFFLLYRKQYMPALILFIASIAFSMIPFGGLLVMILSGGFSAYFVYKGYSQKKLEIEASIEDEEKRLETMRYVGGYNQWVVWVYIVFTTISMALMVFGVIAASMMPEAAYH